MEQIAEEIAEVTATIVRVEAKLEQTEKRLDAVGLSDEDVAYWRKKEEQLRKEKEQLRTEKEQLRKEKEQLREKEMLLSQPRPQLPPRYPAERDELLQRKVDLLIEHTVRCDRATPQYSAAFIGNREKKRLESDKRFTEVEEHAGQESILSAEELDTLSQMENEHQVVAFITPHLKRIFCNHGIDFSVFNSEEYKWIETSSETTLYNEKPDLLICHPAIASDKPPFKTQDTKLNQMRKKHSFEYGVLSDWKLRDAIGLTCEAKVSINNQSFGEVINYGAHLCFGKNGCTATRLILFDKTQCWLIDVVKGSVADVKIFKWCDEGSATLLRDFVRQAPLIKLLTEACRHFRLTVGKGSFLGAGAFGFVFRASRSDGRNVALKVVDSDGVLRLEKERAIMIDAHRECPDVVMGVEEDGFAVFEDTGAALLLSQVGDHYSKLGPQSIVDSLKELHKSGIVHGDARLENVVCVDGKPVWFDFAISVLPTSVPKSESQADEMKRLKACVREKFNGYDAS